MKRVLISFVLVSAVLVLAGCNGTVSQIGVPAASPWNAFTTHVLSPHDDLTVVTTGNDIGASLQPTGSVAVCNSTQGQFFAVCPNSLTCGLAECMAQAPTGATDVSFQEQQFGYLLQMALTRPGFTAGGVEVDSVAAGTVGAISLTLDAGSGLSVGAGFSAGLIPAPQADPNLEVLDHFGAVAMDPAWPDFGPGYVCTDGTTTSCNPNDPTPANLAAACQTNAGPFGSDVLAFRTNAAPGSYSLTCGTVPVNLSINPPFATLGDCISTLKAQRCGGLKGQAKAACNHAQIGVCDATFNVPSAHNPG
ncbi:MAG: hypothetical protein WAM82_26020 [Thermoanaerobaculia bacterium]